MKSFRHEVDDDDLVEEQAAPDDGRDPIVVHVHVHRDDEGQVMVGVEMPAAPQPAPRPVAAPRPSLTGRLFDWKSHYDLVAKRHMDEGMRPPTLWTALVATVRNGRAMALFVRSRRG